jgi:tetratricopeptide (TPR) repeat protein
MKPATMTRLVHFFRVRLAPVVGAVVILVAVTYAVSALTAPPPPPAGRPAGAMAGALTPVAPAAGPIVGLLERYDGAIRAWSESLEANHANYLAATTLGMTYAGRARLTGDLSDYERALEAAGVALEVNSTYLPARELRATVLFALHDFAAARDEAQAVWEADPGALQALAVVGDSSLELGDLDRARSAFATLGEREPSPPVWSRLAHLAFVEGDVERAIGLVESAVAGSSEEASPEEAAFYAFQLGELYRASGRTDDAAAAYEQALAILPGHVPATAGLARVREAQGRRAEAITLLEAAVARLPQPELVAALGDLHALAGDADAAEEQYALVDRIGEVAAATGSVYDRQLVLFDADHDRDIAAAVDLAQAAIGVRQDIYGYDALAWALFHAGRIDEAAAAADEALALGTRDPRLAYHAGMIAAARHDTDTARRLLTEAVAGAAYLPPLQVPIAEQALAALGEAGR